MDSLFQRCLARMDQGDRRGAEADADALISLDPNHCEAYILRSLIRFPDDLNGSYLDYGRASKLVPRSVEGLALFLTLQIRFWPLTQAVINAAAGDDLAFPDTPLTRGAQAILERNLNLAASEFQSVARDSFDHSFAATGLGLVKYRQKDYRGALQALKGSESQDERVLAFIDVLNSISEGE